MAIISFLHTSKEFADPFVGKRHRDDHVISTVTGAIHVGGDGDGVTPRECTLVRVTPLGDSEAPPVAATANDTTADTTKRKKGSDRASVTSSVSSDEETDEVRIEVSASHSSVNAATTAASNEISAGDVKLEQTVCWSGFNFVTKRDFAV